ncbi:MAG: hypothetical protein AB7Q37_16565 [Pyrinomonadaceae bacterium]
MLIGISCSTATPDQETVRNTADLFPSGNAVFGSKSVKYRVYIPKSRNVDERLPVLLYLHGADDRGSDNEKQLNGLRQLILSDPELFPMIIVFPQCATDRFWDFDGLNDARIVLHDAIHKFDGDETRVYVAGHSLGAYGAWSFAARNRNEIAALIPISGRVLPRPDEREKLGDDLKELTDSDDPFSAIAGRLNDLPIWVFHGRIDQVIPISEARDMVAALKKVGNSKVLFSQIHGGGHDTIGYVFQNPQFSEWLTNKRNTNVSYENVKVTEDIVYHSVLESIVHGDERPFGEFSGASHIVLNGATIAPDTAVINALRGAINSSVLQHFEENNKVGVPLPDSDYGVHFPLYWRKPSRSLVELLDRETARDPELVGVVGLSTVGFDRDRSRSLVYVEFVNSEKELKKKFILMNWLRVGQGLQGSSVRWIEADK